MRRIIILARHFLIASITLVEDNVQSMTIRVQTKLRFIFREKNGEKVISEFIQDIVKRFTIGSKDEIIDSKYRPFGRHYSCVIREE